MAVSEAKRQQQIELYRVRKDLLYDLIDIVNDILDGASEGEACRKHGVKLMRFRTYMDRTNIDLKGDRVTPAYCMYDKEYPYSDWRERFMYELLGPGNDLLDFGIPEDFDDIFEFVTKSALSERAKSVVEMYFKADYTLEDIGKHFTLTRERIRQIIAKSLSKMRNPKWIHWLIFGTEGAEAIRALEDAKLKRSWYIQSVAKQANKLNNDLNLSPEEQDTVDILQRPIDTLELSVRSYNCLRRSGIDTVGDLVEKSYEDILKIRCLGRRSANEISDKVVELGLQLKEEAV